MPRALRSCPTAGCPNLTSGGRCETCATKADRRRGTARQRGYDGRWERTRLAFLRLNPLCVEPGCQRLATDVDHIDGLGPKGPRGFDWSNLRGFCHPHHSQRTARDQPGGWADRNHP